MIHTVSVQTRLPLLAPDLFPWFTTPALLEAWLAHHAELEQDQLELQLPGTAPECFTLHLDPPLRASWTSPQTRLDWSLTPEPQSSVLQLKLSQPDPALASALSSRWRIHLAVLRFALAHHGNPPAIHLMSCLPIPASIPELFPALVYPQWLGEWLTGIRLGRMLESTRRDALHEWPELRATLAFRLSELDPQHTRLCLELRAWDALRLPPAVLTARLDDSLAQLASWW